MGKKVWILLLLASLLVPYACLAQGLTQREQSEVKSRSIQLLKEFELLLNTIASKNTSNSEVEELIKFCYSDSSNRLFYDEKSVLEDDIVPGASDSAVVKDVSVRKYMSDFDLFYTKGFEDNTVAFSDFRLSEIKERQYTFLKVNFESIFKNKHKEFEDHYKPIRRVAEVRVEKQNGNEIVCRITSVTFVKIPAGEDSATYIDKQYQPFVKPKSTGLQAYKQAEQNEDVLGAEKYRRVADSLYAAALAEQTNKIAEAQQKQLAYKSAVRKGDSLATAREYGAAIEAFTEARTIRPYELYPRSKINELTENLAKGVKDDATLFTEFVDNANRSKALRDYENARNQYQKAISLKPGTPEIEQEIIEIDRVLRLKSELKARYMSGDYKGAIKGYNKLIRENKTNPEFYVERGNCYARQNQFEDAIKDLSKAIELDESYTEPVLQRAFVYTKTNNFPKAIADYTVLISKFKDNAQYYSRRGSAYQQVNDFNAATDDFSTAVSLEPGNLVSKYNLAFSQYKKGSLNDANKNLNDILAKNKNFSSAYLLRGIISFEQGKFEAARTDLIKARTLGLSTTQESMLDNLSQSKLKAAEGLFKTNSKNQEVEKFLEQSLLANPATFDANMLLAEYWRANQSTDKALISLKNATTTNPSNPVGFLRYGVILAEKNRIEESKTALKKSWDLQPKNWDAAAALGDVFTLENKYDSATIWFDLILTNEKEKPQYFVRRGKAHYSAGNLSRALLDFDEALRLDKRFGDAHFFKGLSNKKLRKYDEALKNIGAAEDLGFDAYKCNLEKGIIHFELSSMPKTIKSLNDAIRLNPTCSQCFYIRYQAHELSNKMPEAASDLDEALKIDATLKTSRNLAILGILKMRTGDMESAKGAFISALEINKEETFAQYGMGCIYFLESKEEAGIKMLEEAFIVRKIKSEDIKKDPWIKTLKKKNKKFDKLLSVYLK
jgi:tetratricopeptide (TPR) repeat protein